MVLLRGKNTKFSVVLKRIGEKSEVSVFGVTLK